MKTIHMKNIVLTLFLAVAVSACGFHLRGNIPLPDGVKNMYVDAPDGSFKEQLEKILVRAGATLHENKGTSDVVLDVKKVRSRRNVATLDDRGKANSFNVRLEVEYELEDANGETLRREGLNESRRYTFDPALVLETESEEADLIEDMEKDIALQMVRQLSIMTEVGNETDG